jgi:hypothetical protein
MKSKSKTPSGYTRESHLWHISVRTQMEVAEILGITTQAVQKQEARAMMLIRKALIADPAALIAVAPEIARKHLSTGAHAHADTPGEKQVQFGGHFLTRDQRSELEHFRQLAAAYDADNQPTIAAEIREEIADLERRLSRTPRD